MADETAQQEYAAHFFQGLGDGMTVMNTWTAQAMSDASNTPELHGDLVGFSKMLGQFGNAVNGASIGHKLVTGQDEAAFEEASELLVGKILEQGYGHVLEKMVGDGYLDRPGVPGVNPSFHKILNDQIAGLGADYSVRAGKEILDQHRTGEAATQESERVTNIRSDYAAVVERMDTGGIEEYSHFMEMEFTGYPDEGKLHPTEPRPQTTYFDHHLRDATKEFADQVMQNPIAEPSLYQRLVHGDQTQPLENFSDFVNVSENNEFLDYSLKNGERLGVNLENEIQGYVSRYGENAETNEGRDIDFRELDNLSRDFVGNADYLAVEMRAPHDDGTVFFNGTIDVSDKDGGVVMIGRDGGEHIGSNYNDISLDGSDVEGRGGDDLIILDRLKGVDGIGDTSSSGGNAYGGIDNDKILGSLHGDHLHGGTGEDIINGDKGDDYLYGTGLDGYVHRGKGGEVTDDNEKDILIGGEGQDTYYTGNNDEIIATANQDKSDVVYFDGIELTGPNLDRYPHEAGEPFKGANDIEYSLEGDTLTVTRGDKSLTIKEFDNGDFGIDLPVQETMNQGTRSPENDSTNPVEAEPINYSPEQEGTTLETSVEYLRDNSTAMNENLENKRESGTITPDEQALSEILQQPEAATVFGNLQESGVGRLNVRLDENAPPEHNGIEIYRAVSEAATANNIRMDNSEAVQSADYQRETQEAEMSYGIA